MNVSAVIVTRGDVPLDEILDSLPREWQKVIWNNAERQDLAVYGRYAAIAECEHQMIYVQDDDCVLAPESIAELVAAAERARLGFSETPAGQLPPLALVANMPQRFRENPFYADHCLVGFGAIFHRNLAWVALGRFAQAFGVDRVIDAVAQDASFIHRTCDIVFTALTPRVLVDVPYRDLPHAHAENRMWKSAGHVAERTRMLELVRQVRDE